MVKSSATKQAIQPRDTFRSLALVPDRGKGRNIGTGKGLLKEQIHLPITSAEMQLVKLIELVRPRALRAYDQIPMRSRDLLRQTKLMAPYLADKEVVFVGDGDCASLLLGLLGNRTHVLPKKMLLLDFDHRLLDVASNIAHHYGFDRILEVQAYNVFDSIPEDQLGRYDWFYTNPPYGSHNNGESGQLFITRGCELVRPGGSGCVILPYDITRPWTRKSMLNTQGYLVAHGWAIRTMLDQMHRYHLDDDKQLTSALMLIDDVSDHEEANMPRSRPTMPQAGRPVNFSEIPTFYGRDVVPPYPRYIEQDGGLDFNWNRRGESADEC